MTQPGRFPLAEADTPAVVIDCAVADANIRRCQQYCSASKMDLRPHIKTHKLPAMANRQLRAGAVGITCQKLGEAEAFAEAGCDDILLTYNIVGPAKLARLRELAGRVRIAVVADSTEVVAGLHEAFADAVSALEVLVECDTGLGRCGVQTPESAAELAAAIAGSAGLAFGGLMTYPAVGKAGQAAEFLDQAKKLCAQKGLTCARISSGNTPDLYKMGDYSVFTEVRPGTYIYNDRSLLARGSCAASDCALTVLATVVSAPAPGRAIIDAGSKALTSDLLGLSDYGELAGRPEVAVSGLSEEHGHLSLPPQAAPLAVGDRVRVLPNHACPVTNLFDEVLLLDGDGAVEPVAVSARGRMG